MINANEAESITNSAKIDKSCASSPFSKPKGFKIGQINIASLVKHHNEFLVYMQSKSYDILAVNETRLDNSMHDFEVDIPGYDIVRLYRNKNGGAWGCNVCSEKYTIYYLTRLSISCS